MALYGVDIHGNYQAGISFARLRAEGYSFVTVKATEGTGFLGPRFLEWMPAIRAQGLIPGAYHWLSSADGAAQARFFYNRVVQGGGPRGMLIQLDCEDDGYGPVMRAWANEWNRLSGNHPFLIYSGAWWWPRTNGFRGADLTPYLWHSRYLTADPDAVSDNVAAFAARIPDSWWNPGYGGWSQATFLQFSYQGDAGGLGNSVDLNVTRMSRDQLLGLAGLAPNPSEDDDMTPEQATLLEALAWRTEAILQSLDTVRGGPTRGEPNVQGTLLEAMAWRTEAILQNLAEVRGGPTKGERNELHFALQALGVTLTDTP